MSNAQPETLKRNRWSFSRKGQSGGKVAEKDETFYRAGQWQLVWWKFRRHKLAQIAMAVLGIFYIIALFAEFISPYDPQKRFKDYSAMAPAKVHLLDAQGNFHLPFVYALKRERDPVTLRPIYKEDTSKRYSVSLFVPGDEYKLWGLVKGNIHLFGTRAEPGVFVPFFLLGSDSLGHDLLSRVFFGGRISLTVGLIGIFLAFLLGLFLGGIAGFFGGLVDEMIMRIIDVLIS
jgi:peptide/nickel transport system permease protein